MSISGALRRAVIRVLEARDRRRARKAPPPDTREVRILLLHANGMGGTIRTVFNLAGHLAQDHDVEIVSVVRESPEPFFEVPPGVRVRYLDDRVNGRRGLANHFRSRLTPSDETAGHWFTLRTDLALLRYIRSRRGGVLIGTRPALNLLIARAAGPEVITIGQEHANLAAHQPETRKQILRRYGRLTALVTLTQADLGAYRKALKRPPARLVQIPNAVTRLNGPPAHRTAPVAVAIGRLNHAKGYDLLIRAWAHVHRRHPDWTLRIYGRGPRHDKLRESIDKRELTGSVHLMGPAEDAGAVLADAALFILSSRREGMPMTVLEAMSKAVPVVAYDCPTGPAEIITHGHDGLLVPPQKIHALADAISTLIIDPDLRTKLATQGRITAAQYDMSVIGPRWEQLLREISSR
ncbi:glycosyltransferase family 4 protein [Acrocarpospora catenulata]|uniref:glycosyltransferase family 4 protein n=1 Tax=Acrocarpospora catenulata TaxID=2836182 RepID=UPI002023B0B7|nr:glycosyltransferase family 4 protein [Acrocarpospora catenulata]